MDHEPEPRGAAEAEGRCASARVHDQAGVGLADGRIDDEDLALSSRGYAYSAAHGRWTAYDFGMAASAKKAGRPLQSGRRTLKPHFSSVCGTITW